MKLGDFLLAGRSYLFPGQVEDTDYLLSNFTLFNRVIVNANLMDVATLRQIIAQSQLAASQKRILLISDAERLSDVMQNTMLKLLEEPPATLVIVLQSTNPDRLLPTVISRLEVIDFKPKAKLIAESRLGREGKNSFEELSKLGRDELVDFLKGEVESTRQALLAGPSEEDSRKIILIDRAINKLLANTNQKLTLDWLLLHLGHI